MKRIHTNRLFSLRVYLFLLVVGLAGMYAVYYFQYSDTRKITKPVDKVTTVVPPLCDNVFCESVDGIRIAAVSVDNAPESWPQAGVSQSPLVYEVPVEGGRTRLFAYFLENRLLSVERIGPVRSLRDAFLDLGASCEVLPVHVGGSPSSLLRVPNSEFDSLNEFFDGDKFLRTSKRIAPHNTYIYGEKLFIDLKERREIMGAHCQPFSSRTGSGISQEKNPAFDFGELSITWQYSTSTAQYTRGYKKVVQKDEDGKTYVYTNVLHLYMPMKTIDEKLRRDISTTGSGRFELFSGGVVVGGTWSRKNIEDSIQLRADNGDIVSPSGTTWVTILPETMAPKSLQ